MMTHTPTGNIYQREEFERLEVERLQAINADLLAALEALQSAAEEMAVAIVHRARTEDGPNPSEAARAIYEADKAMTKARATARVAIAKAKGE